MFNLISRFMSYKFTYRIPIFRGHGLQFGEPKEVTIYINDIQVAHRYFRELVGDVLIISIHPFLK